VQTNKNSKQFWSYGGGDDQWGYDDFAERSKVLNSLVDGALVIEVNMKVVSPPPFIPENPSACKIIQGLFLNDESADIVFEVNGAEQPKDNARKVAKTSAVTFSAHRLIVANCSSIFAELCESNSDNRTTPIQIDDIAPDVFHLLLFYMYGGKVSDDDISHTPRSSSTQLIDMELPV